MEPVNLALAFTLKPEAALEYFRSKGFRINASGWAAVIAETHATAFTVARVARLDLLQDIKNAVVKALDEGTTLQDFQKRLMPTMKARGFWGIDENGVQLGSPHRLATIFRTNIQVAYQRGRWQGLMDNIDDRPWFQYVAILDSRTRPMHRLLNAKIFRYDDPFWTTHRPPLSWNCRCRLRALSDQDLQERNLTPESGAGRMSQQDVMAQGYPQPQASYHDPVTGQEVKTDVGWGYDRRKGWEPDPGRYTPELRGILGEVKDTAQQMALSTSGIGGYAGRMDIINHPQWEPVSAAIKQVANQHPEWFPHGYAGIYAVANTEMYAGTYGGKIYFSDSERMHPGFRPATSLASAINKINAGKKLEFIEEYAVESLWHEIIHAAGQHSAKPMQSSLWIAFESIVQLVARHTYSPLLENLGGNARHQNGIIKGGIAYSRAVGNLRKLLEILNIDERSAVEELYVLAQSGARPDDIPLMASQRLAYLSGQRVDRILFALKRLEVQSGFEQKVKQKLSYPSL